MEELTQIRKSIKWSARKLLEMVLYFTYLQPDRNNWSFDKLYKVREKVRFQRILSLFKAFDIEDDYSVNVFEDFIDGEILNLHDIENYTDIISYIEKYSGFIKDDITLSDILDFFYHLLNYRIAVEKALRLYDFPVEASFRGHIAGIRFTEELIEKSKEEIKFIDDMLVKIIDPFNKEFSEYELIKDYGFPIDNLNKIDDDYWVNY